MFIGNSHNLRLLICSVVLSTHVRNKVQFIIYHGYVLVIFGWLTVYFVVVFAAHTSRSAHSIG